MSPIVASKLARNMQAVSRERRIAYLEGLHHICRRASAIPGSPGTSPSMGVEWRRAMLAKEEA